MGLRPAAMGLCPVGRPTDLIPIEPAAARDAWRKEAFPNYVYLDLDKIGKRRESDE